MQIGRIYTFTVDPDAQQISKINDHPIDWKVELSLNSIALTDSTALVTGKQTDRVVLYSGE